MTREEAIKWLEETIQDTDTYWESCSAALQKELDEQKEVFLLAISALRPVSREQVEKVFGGKWEEETYTTVSGRGRVKKKKKYTCSVCGKANGRAKTNFCPHCGASQTDEAVEMVMERLEVLNDV